MAKNLGYWSLFFISFISTTILGFYMTSKHGEKDSKPMTEFKHSHYTPQMCQQDQARIDNLFKAEADKVSMVDWEKHILMDPLLTGCDRLKRIGGHYLPSCHVFDGQKYTCMDNFKKNNCLIFSFGLAGDITWELGMTDLGCIVYGFDPSIDKPENLPENFIFRKLGVENVTVMKEDMKFQPLKDILEEEGHAKSSIFYLKMDVETSEIEGLKVWIQSGALDNVNQFGIELHWTGKVDVARKFSQAFRDLYKLGFRLISHDYNACDLKNWPPNAEHTNSAEVVFQRQASGSKISTICG